MASSVATIRRHPGYAMDAHTYYPVLIVGAGESGIAMGCRLKETLNFDQFRIFDRQSGIGGTWWINRYPGVACDMKKDWATLYPSGSEIAQYLAYVCEKYQIVDKIQLNTDVKELRWLEDAEEWQVTLTHLVHGAGDKSQHERDRKVAMQGENSVYLETEIVRAKIVVSGVGGLVEPKSWPKEISGIENFQGDIVHTARWDENIDLRGKDVVVVGSGCSAAQVVPSFISPQINAKSVTQLMRTPPWVQPDFIPPRWMPVWDKYSPVILRYVPGLARLFRILIFFIVEFDFLRIFWDNGFGRRRRPAVEQRFMDNMRANVPAKYHEILTPNYSLGCKRRIINNDWYRSLQAPNVELTTSPLISVQSKSVTLGPPSHRQTNDNKPTGEARQIAADAIILANGYQTNKFLHPLQVIGKNGKNLSETWDERGGAQAYLGIAMDHFPNFFMVFGPNTATGHNSVIFASENAVNYTLKFIKPILDGHVSTYEITEEAERNWTSKVQDGLQKTVFKRGACASWYQTENGWNSSTYPFTQIDYCLRCTFPVWRHWTAKFTQKGLRVQRLRSAVKWATLTLAILAGVFSLREGTYTQHVGRWKEMIVTAKEWVESAIVGYWR